MTDYEEIKQICERTSRITSTVIDDFILHYAAAKDNLAREFDQRVATYKHITRQLEASWVNMLKSQIYCAQSIQSRWTAAKVSESR